jgi:hypothetical protein
MARRLRPYFAEWDAVRGVHVVTYLDEPERPAESPAPGLPPAPAPPPESDVAPVETKPVQERPRRRKSAVAGLVERARTLVREQLAKGPKPGAEVAAAAEALEIPERSLIAAADALGVRTQRGQWWLPG